MIECRIYILFIAIGVVIANQIPHLTGHCWVPLYTQHMLATLLTLALLQETLDTKINAMLPNAEEQKWLQIPWETNLMKARARAQKEGKPMFWWIMNGHPLGCT